jgi:hypothetical protein
MRYILSLFLTLSVVSASAQTDTNGLFRALEIRDSLLFNVGFNNCDISQFEDLISDDFEFYHDQAGITSSKKEFINGISNGLCKLPYKPRIVLLKNTLAVFPMRKNGVLYGVVQTGEHEFYAVEKQGSERLTSKARFLHVWLLQNGKWMLARGISYDHH